MERTAASYCIKTNEGRNGLQVQFIVIAYSIAILESDIKNHVQDQLENIQSHIQSFNKQQKKTRSKKIEDYIERFSIKYVKINEREEELQNFKGSKSILTKTGSGNFNFFYQANANQTSKFKLIINWDKITIDSTSKTVYSETSQQYDIVKHQVEVILKQTSIELNKPSKKSNLIITIFYAIIEGFVDYFKTLVQYIQNPYIFSELLASKNFISPGKIINLYLIGLVCSITIPAVLSGGLINANNLASFSDLPPFVSDISELLFEFVEMLFVTTFIHLIAKIKGRKGSFGSMFLGLIFMKAFLQLFERTYNYVTDLPLLNLVNGDVEVYNKIVYQFLSPLIFLIYAYFLYPLANAVYKISRAATVLGWSIAYVIMIFITMVSSQDLLVSEASLTSKRFQDLLEQEKKTIEIYKAKVIPSLGLGDKTGDYSTAIEGLDECNGMLKNIVAECAKVNKDISNLKYEKEKLKIYSNAECEYFDARLQLYFSLEKWLKNKGTKEEFEGKNKKLEDAMKKLNQLNQLNK